MTDQDIRALERAWKDSGTLEDEAAYVVARTRAGDLREIDVRLAAALGDRSARRALGQDPGEGDSNDPDWLCGQWEGAPAISALLEVCVHLLEGADQGLISECAPCLISAHGCVLTGSPESARRAMLASAAISEPEKSAGARAREICLIAKRVALRAADHVNGLRPNLSWEALLRSMIERASRFEPEPALRRVVVRGACRQLLGREPNAWLKSCETRGLPARPPLESTIESLRSTLRWVGEHLGSYRQLRDQGDQLAEVELLHLVNEVRAATFEAERLSDILALWDCENDQTRPD